jgi:hypothetical protein
MYLPHNPQRYLLYSTTPKLFTVTISWERGRSWQWEGRAADEASASRAAFASLHLTAMYRAGCVGPVTDVHVVRTRERVLARLGFVDLPWGIFDMKLMRALGQRAALRHALGQPFVSSCPRCKARDTRACMVCSTRSDPRLHGVRCPRCKVDFPRFSCRRCRKTSPAADWVFEAMVGGRWHPQRV